MMIPTVVGLSDFFINNFGHISWYPYWYLGNPYYFLIGPIVPLTLLILSFLKLPLTQLYFGLIFLSMVISGWGIYIFLKDLQSPKPIALISGLTYVMLPFSWLLLQYQNGLQSVALGVLPFILLFYKRFLEKEDISNQIITGFLIGLSLLINVASFIPIITGCLTLLWVTKSKESFETVMVKSILILLLGISLTTVWYTPRFWWITLSNPSFGGRPLLNLIHSLFLFLIQFLPILLAFWAVKIRKINLKGIELFSWLFFGSFLFLTLVRFISDPDFVIDWLGFVPEIQLGLALVMGGFVFKILKQPIGKFAMLSIFLLITLLDGYIFRAQFAIGQVSSYQTKILAMLKANVKNNERVFLSGSSVFWLNSLIKIPQVRGGVDQGSIHPWWSHAAYQIREGENSDLAYKWLKALGVSYILVHGKDSKEIFHDYKYGQKFSNHQYFQPVFLDEGDIFYKIKDSGIARVAEKSIVDLHKPSSGSDGETLDKYVSLIQKQAMYKWRNPGSIQVRENLVSSQLISLAISYDPDWQITKGDGRIVSDSLGNIAVIPRKTGINEFILEYKRSDINFILPLLFTIIIFILILKFETLNLSFGSHEDDY